MKGDIRISKKSALLIAGGISLFAMADFVSIVDTKSTGGINVTGGMTETEVNAAIQSAIDTVKADYENQIAELKTDMLDELPIGTVAMWGTSTPPNGWIAMKGQSISGYSELSAIYGSTLPDLRGEFVRGWDDSRGVDTSRIIGSYQAGTKIAGENGYEPSMNTHTIHNINNIFGDPIYETNFETKIQYDTETSNQTYHDSTVWWKTVRPRNIALMYIVKAENTEN